MSNITTTSVLIGIAAIGGLVFAAYYMKKRKDEGKTTEETTTQQVVDAKPAPTEQQKLAMAAGMMMPQRGLVQTPVGFMMN